MSHIYESTLQYTTHHGVFIVGEMQYAKREAKHTILGVDSWSTNNIPRLHTINALAYIRTTTSFPPSLEPEFRAPPLSRHEPFFDHGC